MAEETPETHTEHFLQQIKEAEDRLNSLMVQFVKSGFEVSTETGVTAFKNANIPSVRVSIARRLKR